MAVFLLVASGVWRQPSPSLSAPPTATPPIIVEPIQPTAAAQLPSLPAGQRAVVGLPLAPAAGQRAVVGLPLAPAAGQRLPLAVTAVAAKPKASQTVVASAVDAAPTALPAEGPARVRTVQQALQASGYSPGAVDGRMGQKTQKAIRAFQEAHGLSVDGNVGPKTWAKLAPYLQPAESSADTTTPSNNE